jgi:NAD-dependent SIR2 family protein deacetylase
VTNNSSQNFSSGNSDTNGFHKESFLRYKPERDLLFVLGAGASHPDGVPLQKHILPSILSSSHKEIANSEIGKEFSKFFYSNFKASDNSFPELEAVFGFLDYFILQNESISLEYSVDKIRHIKEYLIKLIHYIIDFQKEERSKYYHLFWDAVNRQNQNSSFITLNYDTLFEQAFEFLFHKSCYIDYCINFMNYETSDKFKPFNYWINPREPVIVKGNENPVSYKIIKVHGSLNWKYCNCCNQTLLTPWDQKIDLDRGKFLGYTYPDNQVYEYKCPFDGTEFQTLIMPPSFVKPLYQLVIAQLLNEASKEIRIAKRIVFIGYSLSNADIHIKAIFKKNLQPGTEVIVVNPRRTEGLQLNYRALAENAEFIFCTFEEMVQDEALMNRLLKPL